LRRFSRHGRPSRQRRSNAIADLGAAADDGARADHDVEADAAARLDDGARTDPAVLAGSSRRADDGAALDQRRHGDAALRAARPSAPGGEIQEVGIGGNEGGRAEPGRCPASALPTSAGSHPCPPQAAQVQSGASSRQAAMARCSSRPLPTTIYKANLPSIRLMYQCSMPALMNS
jgi:hypothetical protein